MRISQTNGPQRTSKSTRTGASGSAGRGAAFGALLDEAAGTDSSAPAAGLGGVNGIGLGTLLGLSGEPDDQPKDPEERAKARAHSLLDHLDQIRVALLTGLLPAASLSGLVATAARARDEVRDPALAAVLDEVDLRAQVELAKLERLQALQKA